MLLHGGVPSAYESSGETLSDETPTSGCVYVLQLRSSKHDVNQLKAPLATRLATSGATKAPAGLSVDGQGFLLNASGGSSSHTAQIQKQQLAPRLALNGCVPHDTLNGHTLTPVGPSSVLLTGGRFGSKPSNMDEVRLLDCKTGTWYTVHVPAKLDAARSKASLAVQPGPTPPLLMLQRDSVDSVHVHKVGTACPPQAVRSGAVAALDTSLGSVGALAPVEVLAPKLPLDVPADVPTIANWEARVARDNPLAVKPVHQHCTVWLGHRRALLLFGGHHSRGRFVNKTYVLQLRPPSAGSLLAPGPHAVDTLPPLGDAHQPGSAATTYRTASDALSALLAPGTAWHFQHCSGAPPWADWHPRNAAATQKGAVPVTFPPSTGQHATAVLRRWVRLGPWAAASDAAHDPHAGTPRSCMTALPPPPPPQSNSAESPPCYALQEFLVVVGGKHKHNACLGKAFMLNLHTWVWQRVDCATDSSIPPQMAAPNLFGHIAVPVPGAMQLLVFGGASVQKGHSVASCNGLPQLLDIGTRHLSVYPLEPHTVKGTAALPALAGRGGALYMRADVGGGCVDAAVATPSEAGGGHGSSGSSALLVFGGEDMAQLARGEGSETVVDAACYAVRYKGTAVGWGSHATPFRAQTQTTSTIFPAHSLMPPPAPVPSAASAAQYWGAPQALLPQAPGVGGPSAPHAPPTHAHAPWQQPQPAATTSPTTDPRSLHDADAAAAYVAYPPGMAPSSPHGSVLFAEPPSHLTAGQHPHDILSAALAELRHMWSSYENSTALVSRLASLGDTTSPVFQAQVEQQQRVMKAAAGPGVALSQAANWAWARLKPQPARHAHMSGLSAAMGHWDGGVQGGLQATWDGGLQGGLGHAPAWGPPPTARPPVAVSVSRGMPSHVPSNAAWGSGGGGWGQPPTIATAGLASVPESLWSGPLQDGGGFTPQSSAAGSLSGSARTNADIWGEPASPSMSMSTASTWGGVQRSGFNASAAPYQPPAQSQAAEPTSRPWSNMVFTPSEQAYPLEGISGLHGPVGLPPGLDQSATFEVCTPTASAVDLQPSASIEMRPSHSVHWAVNSILGDADSASVKSSDGIPRQPAVGAPVWRHG